MADCSQCKDFYAGCQGKEFYEPREIKFCPFQIIWLIQNIGTLHEYSWVKGYKVAIPRRKKPGGGGYFTTPADYAYEVERRLEHCGLDGLLAYLYYGYDFEERLLAKYYRLDPGEVKHRIEAVIWWICGWNFYPRPYRRWNVYRDYENWQSQREVKVA